MAAQEAPKAKKIIWVAAQKPRVVLGSGDPFATIERKLERTWSFGKMPAKTVATVVACGVGLSFLAFLSQRAIWAEKNLRTTTKEWKEAEKKYHEAQGSDPWVINKHKIGQPAKIPTEPPKFTGHAK